MKHRTPGFTLIEIMISIAILATFFASLFIIATDMRWISHEADYFNAVRLMKLNDKLVREKSFYSLPPEVKIIPPDGSVSLANRFILPKSVVVMTTDNSALLPDDYRMDSKAGVMTFLPEKLVGKKVIIKYSYTIPDSGELCRVPEKSPYSVELMNSPISDVLMVERIDGRRRTLMTKSCYSFNPGGGSVSFDKNMTGKVVEVKYIGKKIMNICTGRFVDPGTLNESGEPTGMKIITIREVYGGGGNTIETVQVRRTKGGRREVGGRRTEVGGQKSEDGGRKSEDGSHFSILTSHLQLCRRDVPVPINGKRRFFKPPMRLTPGFIRGRERNPLFYATLATSVASR